MLELLVQSGKCPACGTGVAGAREGGASLEARASGWLGGVSRERSALAYGSGFAGVFYLFRYPLAPLALSHAGWLTEVAAALLLLSTLLAPLALALSVAAGAALDRSPGKSGVLPALFGFTAGMWGCVTCFAMLDPVWRVLARF